MDTGDPPQLDTPRNSLTAFRVSKFKELEIVNIQLLERIRELELLCSNLAQQNKELIIQSKKSEKNISPLVEEIQQVYETDEEELTKETEWILHKKKRNKKQKPNSPLENIANSSQICSIDLPEIQVPQKSTRPPPIVINTNKSFNELHTSIKLVAKGDFTIKILNENIFKISTFSGEDYREITKSLNEKQADWHSYEDKQIRPIRVVAKNLHHSCDPEEIISDLKQQGFKIISAINKYKFRSKNPLNIFVLSFDSTESIDKIFKINKILNTIVNIEQIRLPKQIPQCKNCQSYNHTKNYCSKQPRCVRCAGKHESKSCDKPQNALPKCCNCGEKHPASYRGCEVAKELQKLRNRKMRERNVINNRQPLNQRDEFLRNGVQLQNQWQQQRPQESSDQHQQQYSQEFSLQPQHVNQNKQHHQKPQQQSHQQQNHQIFRTQNLPNQQSQNKAFTRRAYSDVTKTKSLPEAEDQKHVLGVILEKLEKLESVNQSIENRLLSLEQNFCYYY